MRMKLFSILIPAFALFFLGGCSSTTTSPRHRSSFNQDWYFTLENPEGAESLLFDHTNWRQLNLPHDWSIEGEFSEQHAAGVGGGALPGGTGWYRKSFVVPSSQSNGKVFIDFDGIYWNSEVWINGHYLGKRPNGYISFQYDLTPHIIFGADNVITVKVDNAQQPNSRWYSGSGIYRNVWLVATDRVHVDYNGSFIQTPEASDQSARVNLTLAIRNESEEDQKIETVTVLKDASGTEVGRSTVSVTIGRGRKVNAEQEFNLATPNLWSIDNPYLYNALTTLIREGKVIDQYETPLGVRYFNFNAQHGFSLNGKSMKIQGVCLHHDLGCLGSAIHPSAIERQLAIMKGMGVNAIRTSHNPPAPELLDLCDKMGFIVMDEMFDMWKRKKSEFDYSQYWEAWHERDLRDFIQRDRNHPSVMIWSIGNEIGEQWDSTGTHITRELVSIVRSLDTTRPITTANNEIKNNHIIKSEALDLIGYNYNHAAFATFPNDYPGQKLIGAETTSALATRGHYDFPSDTIKRWPIAWDKPFTTGNTDHTVSAYDQVSAPWGSTHEETWREVKKYDFVSGMFIWTGFDYLGEPTPYGWPSRSSYFGVVDLAGFPKDAYYLYQSEWTDKPVLHIFPHWNWTVGQQIDVWAYFNQADEVELFINGKSAGIRKKVNDDLHVMWRVPFESGVLKAVSRKSGKDIVTKEVRTAGAPYSITAEADRSVLHEGELAFITVTVVDAAGTIVPDAENLIRFEVDDEAEIVGVDNGNPVSHESFKANKRKAFHGKCLVVLKPGKETSKIRLRAFSDGLQESKLEITIR